MNGTVIRHENFGSKLIPARHVDVWLPPNYDETATHCVLYMHDGQNLFYEAESYAGETWGIDGVLSQLIADGVVPPTIVVGVWNGGDRRWADYYPERPFHKSSPAHQQKTFNGYMNQIEIASDNYLKFLLTELKPFIDSTYTTSPAREQTFIMGSSMGGLISLYALCEYPDQFAGAGCLSTHWICLEDGMVGYVETAVPPSGKHKLYFDHGTAGLDAFYEPYQQKIDTVLEKAGYTQGEDLFSKKFEEADHNEQSWRERLHIPLRFLLKT